MLHGSSVRQCGRPSRPRHGGRTCSCIQNLFHITLPPALEPTWALAIEEQYYFVWAPVVRWLRQPWMLAAVLVAALVVSPVLRYAHTTLAHADAYAHSSGRAAHGAVCLRWRCTRLKLSRRTWLWMGLCGFVLGIAAAATIAGGTAFLDSALSVGFAGAMVAAIASTGARNPLSAALRRGPLAYYGRISYGLYMIHISVFIYFGWFDLKMDRYGIAGNLAVVAFRLAAMHCGGDAALVRVRKTNAETEEVLLMRSHGS